MYRCPGVLSLHEPFALEATLLWNLGLVWKAIQQPQIPEGKTNTWHGHTSPAMLENWIRDGDCHTWSLDKQMNGSECPGWTEAQGEENMVREPTAPLPIGLVPNGLIHQSNPGGLHEILTELRPMVSWETMPMTMIRPDQDGKSRHKWMDWCVDVNKYYMNI